MLQSGRVPQLILTKRCTINETKQYKPLTKDPIFFVFTGKWCHVERFHVPEKYVQAMLADMPNAFINSAREKRHFRPPLWSEKVKVYHYRDYEVDDLISALGQQVLNL